MERDDGKRVEGFGIAQAKVVIQESDERYLLLVTVDGCEARRFVTPLRDANRPLVLQRSMLD